MRRRSTNMRLSRYIAPAGEFSPETCADPSGLLRELWAARRRRVERDAISARDLTELTVWFKMGAAGDATDDDGSPVNEFEHLIGLVRRERDAYMSWVGPMPVSSLVRVLDGRIGWRPPETHVAQDVVELFAAARIDVLNCTVGDVLECAFTTSLTAGRQHWEIAGLAEVHQEHALSLDLLSETHRGAAAVASTEAQLPIAVPDPTVVFDGVYERTRKLVHDVVFREDGSVTRPQVLPRQPGVVLSVTYTLEFLTRWERRNDLIPDGVLDEARRTWSRLALPAARSMDSHARLNATEQLCHRTADTFPALRDLMTRWPRTLHDEPASPADDDEDR